MEVTKRNTLLECLDMMEKCKKAFSKNEEGREPEERYGSLFREYEEKCKILRELIRALESEPVRNVLADWQKLIVDYGPENAMILEQDLDNIRHFDIEDYTGNNGPLKAGKPAEEQDGGNVSES